MIKSIEEKLNSMEQATDSQADSSLHPALKQSKAKLAAVEAQRKNHPYRRSYTKRRR